MSLGAWRFRRRETSVSEKMPLNSHTSGNSYSSRHRPIYSSSQHRSVQEQCGIKPAGGSGLCRKEAFSFKRKDSTESVKYNQGSSAGAVIKPGCYSDQNVVGNTESKGPVAISAGACGRGFSVRSSNSNKNTTTTTTTNTTTTTTTTTTNNNNNNNNDNDDTQPRRSLQEMNVTPKPQKWRANESENLLDIMRKKMSVDEELRADVDAVKERLAVRHVSLVDVRACVSQTPKAATPNRASSMASLETQAEDPAATSKEQQKAVSTSALNREEAPTVGSSPTQEVCCRRKITVCQVSPAAPKQVARPGPPCQGVAWRREVTGKTAPTLSLSDDTNAEAKPVQTSLHNADSSNTKEPLKVGTSVRILAPHDPLQPSLQAGAPQFILAVVTYVSQDGLYKVGTTKGMIGRMFTREEMQVRDRTILRPGQVPQRSVTVREAATNAYMSPSQIPRQNCSRFRPKSSFN